MIKLKYIYRRVHERYLLRRLDGVVRQEIVVKTEKDLLNFIISPGRSGTTLLRKHLLDNTSIHIPPESSSLIIEIAKLYLKQSSWEQRVMGAIKVFEVLELNQFWRMDIQLLQENLLKLPEEQRSLQSLVIQFYRSHANKYKPNASIYVDKTPFLSQNLQWLQTIFPNSNYVFLIRDPFEVTYSRMVNFGENLKIASDKWIWALNEFDKYRSQLAWKLIFYEDLIKDFEVNLRQIADYFESKWLDQPKSVELGEESLMHHNRVLQKVEGKQGANLSVNESLYLKRKLSLFIKNQEVKTYYNL